MQVKHLLGTQRAVRGLSGLLYAAATCESHSIPSVRCCRTINPHVAVAITSLNKYSGKSITTSKEQFSIPRLAWSPLMNHGTQVASLSSTSSFGMSGVNSHAVIAHSASPLASPSVKSTHVSNMKYAWCAPALNYFCRTANVKQDGETSELYYHSVFNKSDVAFLYDHSVNGNCILPGAASLEAVHACSRADIFTDFGLIYVINTAFLRPILITKELVLVTKRSVMHGTVRMHASVGHPPAVGVRAKCRILSSIRQKYSFGLARINIFSLNQDVHEDCILENFVARV